MKKTLSLILSLLLVFSVCAPAFAKEAPDNSDLKIAVASDLHYNQPREEIDGPIDDEIFWYANRRAAMEDESGFIIDEFLRQCEEDDSVSYVLISGDMADNGKTRPEDHRAVAAKLESFEQRTGKDVFVINGNHDAGEESDTTFAVFKDIYKNLGYDKALEKVDDDCSYTADLGEKYRLICLDSCSPTESTEDGMNLKKTNWVLKQADKAFEDGRYPVLMMHHNLLDHMPLQRIISHDFIVRFHYSTANLFADHGIKVVLSGHEHCSDASSHTSPAGNVIYDFATTSLTMYPLAYRVFTFTDDKITYEAKTVEKIDTDALTAVVGGYSEEQINLMNEGLNDYSKGFLKAGVQYRLWLSLTMEKLGIDSSSLIYDLVKTAVVGLTDMLAMPLYGKGSLQELGRHYAIEIPETSCSTGWDLATELVAAHYAGEESYDLDSPEITALLRSAALILRVVLPEVNDDVFLRAVTEMFAKDNLAPISETTAKLCANVFGGVKPGEYFTVALLSPFLYEFAFDSDGVNDNSGEIEGCGSVDFSSKTDSVFSKIKSILEKFILYFSLFFRTVSKMF